MTSEETVTHYDRWFLIHTKVMAKYPGLLEILTFYWINSLEIRCSNNIINSVSTNIVDIK